MEILTQITGRIHCLLFQTDIHKLYACYTHIIHELHISLDIRVLLLVSQTIAGSSSRGESENLGW